MKSKEELYHEFEETITFSTAKDREVIDKKYSAYPPKKWWLAGWDACWNARQEEIDDILESLHCTLFYDKSKECDEIIEKIRNKYSKYEK